MTLRRIAFLCTLLFIAARPALGQSRPVTEFAGCYTVTRDDWSRPIGVDSVYYVMPGRVRLDTLPSERGGAAWQLAPNIAYPYPRKFPGMPSWRLVGDSVRLVWSNGFSPTIVTLLPADSGLVGEAVALKDYHWAGEPPPPRARVRLVRRACDGA